MSEEALKEKIFRILKTGFFNGANDFVDVSDGPADDLHVVVVSRKFDGRRMRDRDELIASELEGRLTPDEWGRVSLTIGASPEQVKAVG